ncbi:nuclear transport factor 2 family protein [Flavobacterium sp. LHD-80]|uniref:nuclear transport factor 2 family protein n=1 Tax=Flavobacterium sp. LHD-80 TaxID=3071411 RepID=UPI0027E1146F|nr:nuclear transport factor 2 family protein [Flavobacterium sp. LHD-80]MDQ6471932.1 nuclear transport factor 2 family protein [Flavobacterium sp. LHD-80]
MRKALLFISLNFFFLSANAQLNDPGNDWSLIQKTLNLYLDGQATGDSIKVGQSFHNSWQLKYFADNKLNIVRKSDYIKGYKAPNPRSPNWSGRIISIDITNNVAAAKVEISTSKLLFIDYFNLMKINQDWFIVDKISTRIPHKMVEAVVAKTK